MLAYLSEFVGTFVLVLLGDGVVANVVLKDTKGNNSGWIVITAGWGFAVALAAYSVGWMGGAHLNPAVTVGLASIGAFSWGMVPGYIITQMLGAFLGSTVAYIMYRHHFDRTEDPALKLACFCTGPEIRSNASNFFSEVVGTAMLLFGILALTNPNAGAGGGGTFLVGILVFGIGLSLGGTTGYAINPARDLGPRIAHAVLPIKGKGDSDWGYAWIPVVAPIIGGVIGAVLYNALISVA